MELIGTGDDGFTDSRARFEQMLGFLDGPGAAGLDHGELEERLQAEGRELLRLLYQDHLDLRAAREPRLAEVTHADGVDRPWVEGGHTRALSTVFGPVVITRRAYRARGQSNLHPADGVLNLPVERHSHGLRRLAAAGAARGSFEQTTKALRETTGRPLGKRQVEELVYRAAVDVQAFYDGATRPPADPGDVLVISADGKGIVMRPGALRQATAAAAAKTTAKLTTRLSKGEKRNRKRMAEVGAVYDLKRVHSGVSPRDGVRLGSRGARGCR